ncbi:MAG TPA: DUF6074 family protein [Methyloceanibacter sp.]|nr:DUF6074 family protein [Methyloceanibacter sp.]
MIRSILTPDCRRASPLTRRRLRRFTLSVARRLPASADTDGVMRPDHQALVRELGVDVAAIVAALEQLVRREHLIVVDTARAGERAGYRFAGRSLAQKPPRAVVPFPRRRQRDLVEHHARNIARISPQAARLYLRRMMRVYAEEMRSRGIAEPIIEREVDALAAAIRAATWAAVLTPDDQEPA